MDKNTHSNIKQGRVIVIAGYLAAGKSTFALRLSRALNIPYFIKDTFKSAICSSLRPRDTHLKFEDGENIFSAVTFDAMIYAAERLLETGTPVIIEGNFVPGGVKKKNEAAAIKTLTDAFDCQPLTFKFKGDPRVLHKRFIERDKLPERGEANRMPGDYEPSFEEFSKWCVNLDAFDIGGKVIEVDTTDFAKVDFNGLIEAARR